MRWCAATLRPERSIRYSAMNPLVAGHHYRLTVFVSCDRGSDDGQSSRRWCERQNANATWSSSLSTVPPTVASAWMHAARPRVLACAPHELLPDDTPHVNVLPRVVCLEDVCAALERKDVALAMPSTEWLPLLDPAVVWNRSEACSGDKQSVGVTVATALAKRLLSATAAAQLIAPSRALASTTNDDLTVRDVVVDCSQARSLSHVEAMRCWDRVAAFEGAVLDALRASLLLRAAAVPTPPQEVTQSEHHANLFDWSAAVAIFKAHCCSSFVFENDGLLELLGTLSQHSRGGGGADGGGGRAVAAWYKEFPAPRRRALLRDLVGVFDQAAALQP